MMLLHTGRQAGKTTQAMAWVSHGVEAKGYPGWSRVLVVIHFAEFNRLKNEYWSKLEDFDHRVYTYVEWAEAVHVHPETEVCIDNLDILLGFVDLSIPGRIVAATITAQEWEPQTFRESVREQV